MIIKRSLLGLGVVVILGLGLALSGVIHIPGRGTTHPPCNQLPARGAVESALAANDELVRQIEATGSEVDVRVATPCKNDPDRALVGVRYSSGSEKAAIEKILQTEDGFGVPLDLIKD
jgi:hypothetical protein